MNVKYLEYQKEFDSKTTEFCRGLISEQLEQCTEPQKDLFCRMYGGIDKITFDKMRHAYCQCRGSVENNSKK